MSYLGSTPGNSAGRGAQAGAGDNELSANIYTGSGNCTTTNYGTVFYRSSGAGLAGAVYLRWSGEVPSSNVGGTLSTLSGDNLLSYTAAGTYTLIF
jgi:hypothetical protein